MHLGTRWSEDDFWLYILCYPEPGNAPLLMFCVAFRFSYLLLYDHSCFHHVVLLAVIRLFHWVRIFPICMFLVYTNTDNHFHRTSAWSDLEIQSSYEKAEGTIG